MEKMKMESVDLTQQNIEKIGEIFPNCITETKGADGKMKKAINFGLLKQMLSSDVVKGDEAYEFTWVGKKAAIVEANRPIRKTLRPCVEESVDWDTTENLYIEGDNLEVLKLLQESYLGRVKMIYIDPPYNTGNDFIYRDNFATDSEEWKAETGEIDEDGNRMFKNTDTNGRFHSDWCSMIYSRLLLARNLLAEDGVIFISIDDNEQENLKKCCDEAFGGQNFVAQLIWERAFSPKNDARFVSNSHDYVLMYAKNITQFVIGRLPRTKEANARYSNPDNDPRGVWMSSDISVKTYNAECDYPITIPSGRIIEPPAGRCWSLSKNAFLERLQDNRIWFGPDGNGVPRIKRFLTDLKHDGMAPTSIMFFKDVGHSQEGAQEVSKLLDGGFFSGPKPQRLMQRLLTLANLNSDSIVLDFFSGSASTAQAVMQKNAEDGGHRKFIMVQLPEPCDEKSEAYKAGYRNICEIGKERIRRAGKKILKESEAKSGVLRVESGVKKQGALISTSGESTSLFENASLHTDSTLHTPHSTLGEASPHSTLNKDSTLDVGFRVLKLADSNMKDVYYAPADYDQGMLEGLVSNIKEDRGELDLLFGCLLEWGIPLSRPYRSEEIDGCTVHDYDEGSLMACFDKDIPESVIRYMAKKEPVRAVFRDSSFAGSPDKINVTEIFKELSPDTSVKVL